MQMNLKMEFVNDPGHGWLIVSRKQLDLVGLQPRTLAVTAIRTPRSTPRISP
jgi:hypothetical protein